MSLTDLVHASTPGPWKDDAMWMVARLTEDDAHLVALTPELAAVAIAAERCLENMTADEWQDAWTDVGVSLGALHRRLSE